MKKILYILAAVVLALSVSSCASAEKMAQLADQVKVTNSYGQFLAVKGGVIPADLTVTYPEKFFAPKAILEITPVLVYEGGEEALEPITFQGEKVNNNYRVIVRDGGVVNLNLVFPYRKGMAKSTLELRGRCTVDGKEWVTIPTKKVADGCNITETLAGHGYYGVKDHGYQEIITYNPEGQVMYQINSSVVRSKELKNGSVAEFLKALEAVKGNERETLKGIDIVAYASPEGTEELNNRLSDSRSKSADNAFDKITKKSGLDKDLKSVKSVGEDWEGFKDLVTNSNIEDKDLILRVLNMYSDPKVREKEIRNMSSIFQDLAKDVLPQLRRARFIANVEYRNYSDEELKELIRTDIDVLDEPALLKAASLCKDKADKKTLYKKAVEKYSSEKANFALACVAVDECNIEEAGKYLALCDAADADVLNLKGVCAMRKGDLAKAEGLFTRSNTADAQKNLGVFALLHGDYAKPAQKSGDKAVDAALAQLLAGNTDKALAIAKCKCPKAQYVKAICLARQGKNTEAKEALKNATEGGCKCLAERAATDIEFVNL
ncbi:MAG: hypothetical protein KBS53_00380 [Bacteroidales bacterium]|nr:hypothetical protein [Candidatus Hennigimonas equi]